MGGSRVLFGRLLPIFIVETGSGQKGNLWRIEKGKWRIIKEG
jgi:hypothetical protein